MPDVILIAHNIRSTHNIGALFRTAEGLGVQKILLSGYSPHPLLGGSNNSQKEYRLPHIAQKLHAQIHKTALDAESIVPFEYYETIDFTTLRQDGYVVVGLEQTPESILLPDFTAPEKIALVLGEEVEGIPGEILKECELCVEIPMRGTKESFNVSVAAGMALYALFTA